MWFLRWRHARLALQLPLLLLAALVIYDGLFGLQVAPLNLAGVLPWIHWRGFVVLGLLVAGNVFCMACPFLVPRTLARRWLPQGRAWPRVLRNKWLAVALLVVFFWAYEAFSLWDSPWWTAWVALTYFVAAFVIDGFFRGAAFCKYVCPIGQFNFVQSLVSPLEVKVREPEVCGGCRTKDCIRGRDGIPGCELHLFQPRKAGNLDCTFCLDCVHACPHDNVTLGLQQPAAGLWNDRPRSGLGQLARRKDVAALVVVLCFAAFANAAGMVAPVVALQDELTAWLGFASRLPTVTLGYMLALSVAPLVLVGAAALMCRWFGESGTVVSVATRYVYALAPLAAGMWLAHYSFHLFTTADAVYPAARTFSASVCYPLFADADTVCDCCRPPTTWLPRLELVFLGGGLVLGLYTAFRLARSRHARLSRTLAVAAPWAALLVLLFALGVWVVLQPMEMRGTLGMAG